MRLILSLAGVIALTSLAGCGGGSGESNVSAATGSNSAPSISGTPPSDVNVDERYSFLPVAVDPDGDRLFFDIQNKPVWASFDTANGRISGIPTMGNIGTYPNISITVSDGESSASMPQFSVMVSEVQPGSVTLSWTAPIQNTDGTTLTDLSAYNIYFGNALGTYPNKIRVENASISSYVIDNLTPSTYYFIATSVNSQGIESANSDPAQVTIE